MTAIGIDPSLSATGIVCIANNASWESRVIKSKPSGNGVVERIERYNALASAIMAVVEPWEPKIICIEAYSFGSYGGSMTKLAEFGGLLRNDLLSIDGVVLHEVAPGTLKKFATGKGNASKLDVVKAVITRWNAGLGTDDEYDAFTLAKVAACIAGYEHPTTKAQRECLGTITGERFALKTEPTELPF